METTCAPIVASAGLILDIIGAIMIFRFGLPENIDRSGKIYRVTSGVDEEEKRKARFYDRMSPVGILLLILGFGMQLVANWL